MTSKEEIKKLSDLARIEVKDEELESLRSDMESILEYVKSIQGFHPDENFPKEKFEEGFGEVNVMREDENPTKSETYNKDLIAEFPNSQNNYLKVKKIL